MTKEWSPAVNRVMNLKYPKLDRTVMQLTRTLKISGQKEQELAHDRPLYLACPDVLSLLGEFFREKSGVHRIVYSVSYFFFNY
jgi:hypothetical protein